MIAGSELKIGLLKGSRRRNLAYKGSRLNSGFLRYTSPIDREICIKVKREVSVWWRRCARHAMLVNVQVCKILVLNQTASPYNIRSVRRNPDALKAYQT